MKKLLLLITMSLSFIACDSSTTSTGGDYYTPTPRYTCDYVYDTLSGNYIYACFWTYYSSNGDSVVELDLAADVADKETLMIERNAQYYAEKFSLSTEQSLKVAKQVVELNLLEERSAEDIADFAKKLYGIDTSKAISAAGKAQMGDYAELDMMINESAQKFNTSSENMKALIQELHGNALKENGINL